MPPKHRSSSTDLYSRLGNSKAEPILSQVDLDDLKWAIDQMFSQDQQRRHDLHTKVDRLKGKY